MILDGKQTGDGMILANKLLLNVMTAIKNGQVQGDFILTSEKGNVQTLVSTTNENMIPLHHIHHEGVDYYVGIPKEMRADL